MKSVLENRLSMYIAVDEVMTDNATRWAGVPRLVTAVTEHKGNIAKIKSLREVQEGNLKGITEDKTKRRTRMADLAMKIIGAMVAYAVDHDNNEMKRDIGYTRSELVRGRDTTALSRCQKIYNKASRLVPALLEYGITPDNISALAGAIATFDLIIEKPRTAQTMETAALEEMEKVDNATSALLRNRMDKLMLQFKTIETGFVIGAPLPSSAVPVTGPEGSSYPVPPVILPAVDFYLEYIHAREILDLGKHTFHFVNLTVPKGLSITIPKCVDQEFAFNIGKTILTFRNIQSDEGVIMEPGDKNKVNSPTGVIEITNRDSKKNGKIRVKVYKK